MPRCSTCRKNFSSERPLGARCPNCRSPFYEPPRNLDTPPGEDDPTCAAHEVGLSVGPCQRCGNFMCAVCRTKWRDRSVCPECVTRYLEIGGAVPEETRASMLQSVASVMLGVASWVLVLGGFIFAGVAVAEGGSDGFNPALILLAVALLFGSVLPALIGLGLGAAGLRSRGNHMIFATAGVVLSGLHVGAMIGLFSFSLWLNA